VDEPTLSTDILLFLLIKSNMIPFEWLPSVFYHFPVHRIRILLYADASVCTQNSQLFLYNKLYKVDDPIVLNFIIFFLPM
jgi:hypothetical protein